MSVAVEDVEKLASKNWDGLTDATKNKLLQNAQSLSDNNFSGQVSRISEVEGSRDIFVENLAAHLWEIAEGGEATSESGTTGSVSYNTVTGEVKSTLSETRYGRICLTMMRGGDSIGIVSTSYD